MTAISHVMPVIAINGSVVHVVWSDERDGNYEIYYKRSTDGGVSWGADTRLTNNPSDLSSLLQLLYQVHMFIQFGMIIVMVIGRYITNAQLTAEQLGYRYAPLRLFLIFQKLNHTCRIGSNVFMLSGRMTVTE